MLSFVIKGDNSIDYAEERRLFYVAMTRTKNRVYFIAPEQNPSEFLLEIKHDYKNVILKGNWNEEKIKERTGKKRCPMCGYPMQFRYKNSYGLRLYLCTNEPEMCGFMTNEIKADKMAIQKCDKCIDGYLIVKNAAVRGYFLGCTNYKADRMGCNNTIGSNEYYVKMNLSEEIPKKSDTTLSKYVVFKEIYSRDKVLKKNEKKEKSIDDATLLPTDQEKNSEADCLFFSDYKETKNLEDVYYLQYELKKVIGDVLNCLSHISTKHYYGITILVATLRGGDRKQMERDKLKSVPEYGLYHDIKHNDMCAIVQWLIGQHYILKTKEYYSKLHLTYNGNHYKEVITMKQLRDL